MNQDIQDFLKKNMTRKEFVRHIGMILLSVFGAGALLKYMGHDNFQPPKRLTGYGRNSFGGDGLKNISINSSSDQQKTLQII